MAKKLKLGVSGDAGSFSEEAGLLYGQRAGQKFSLVYLTDMEGVLAAVETQKIDLGIFPVVNMRGGLVTQAFEAMGRHLFTVIDELWLDINQCLLVRRGVKHAQIKTVVSHPQALAQCQLYLQNDFKKIKQVRWADTAKAASDLANDKLDKSCAVIAPQRCAKVYGLEVLAKNIQDNHPNLTAFVVVKNASNPSA